MEKYGVAAFASHSRHLHAHRPSTRPRQQVMEGEEVEEFNTQAMLAAAERGPGGNSRPWRSSSGSGVHIKKSFEHRQDTAKPA